MFVLTVNLFKVCLKLDGCLFWLWICSKYVWSWMDVCSGCEYVQSMSESVLVFADNKHAILNVGNETSQLVTDALEEIQEVRDYDLISLFSLTFLLTIFITFLSVDIFLLPSLSLSLWPVTSIFFLPCLLWLALVSLISTVCISHLEHSISLSIFKGNIYAISSDTHQLQLIKLHHFNQERF